MLFVGHKFGPKSIRKCHPSSKTSFSPVFWLKIEFYTVLELSWRHLGANMAPCWGPTWLHVGAQDAPKTRKKRRQCQDEVEKPTPGGVPHRFCSEKPIRYPSCAWFLEHFWFHFAAKLRLCWGIWLHFAFATQFPAQARWRTLFFSVEGIPALQGQT